MTKQELDILTNIIGGVESGGQVYGNRRYDAFAAPYANSPNEHTVTLGWGQNYGNNAQKLVKRVFESDKSEFRKYDTADIEAQLNTNWVATRWNPSASQKQALINIISSPIGKIVQDEMFQEDAQRYIDAAIEYGVYDVGAQMMWCEVTHLGGSAPTKRIFARAEKPWTARTIYNSLKLDQSDTSNSNQVGDKIYQSRHDCCLKWIEQYVDAGKGEITMTKTSAINKVIKIAKAEVGYLEKKSNSQLDSKTANAGRNNYTKYWRDVFPAYQAQAWCACFVTWVFVQALGKETATKLLGHFPFVYCPTLGSIFTKYANPKKGDIVLFYRNGVFAHTGIVTKVSGDKFWTIEGNTSGASGIIDNGGGVCEKQYYNSALPGTKFIRPDYGLVNPKANNGSDGKLNETPKWKGKVKSTKLAVRKYAGTSYDECSFSPLRKGDTVEVCDEVKASKGSTWYYIKFNGKYGFVAGKHIKKIKEV